VLGWRTIAIAGDSMVPTTGPGDWWLVREGTAIRAGDLVAFWHPQRVDLLVVKRAAEQRADGWWVLGDNAERSDDSRVFGAVPRELIVGVLRFRYRRARA
jgi:nickel-type superoxide dismutase maturation protease